MRKLILIVFFLSLKINAQVGIGTTTPEAQLDIKASNTATPLNTDGLLIPRVSAFPTINPTSAQRGILVFLTNTAGIKGPGFYYWESFLNDWVSLFDGNNTSNEWYDMGSYLTPADGINKNVAIGTPSGISKLHIYSTQDRGIFNQMHNTNATQRYLFTNLATGTANGPTYGFYNDFQLDGIAELYGYYNLMTALSSSNKFGLYNEILGNGLHYGVYNDLKNASANAMYGTYNLFGGNGTGTKYGNYNQMTATGSGNNYGIYNMIAQNGLGELYGSFTNISSNNNSKKYGNYNLIATVGNNERFGMYNYFNSTESGPSTGIQNEMFSTNTNDVIGVKNNLHGGVNIIGTHNAIDGNNTGQTYGVKNDISNSNGDVYGTSTQINNVFGSRIIGNYIIINSASSASNVFGVQSIINPSVGGTHYGIFSEALKSGSYAGYFMGAVNVHGRLTIGSNFSSTYVMPTLDGGTGNTMQTDGLGIVNWVNPTVKPYTTTGASTGVYFVNSNQYTVRAFNTISEIRLPNAVGNTGKIFIIIGSNGISSKTWSTSGGAIYDDVSNTAYTTINANQRFMVQSDGNDWIVIGR
ncbi:MAG: hypothetical protein V4670_02325 [Bacteroidota bacterium]